MHITDNERNGWELAGPDDRVYGRLITPESDMFISVCSFEPTDAFAGIASLFAEDLRRLEASDPDAEYVVALEAAIEAVMAIGLELRPLDGGESIHEYILHIDLPARKAWFRA